MLLFVDSHAHCEELHALQKPRPLKKIGLDFELFGIVPLAPFELKEPIPLVVALDEDDLAALTLLERE